VIEKQEKFEGEKYTISCSNVGNHGIINVYMQTENSLKGNGISLFSQNKYLGLPLQQ